MTTETGVSLQLSRVIAATPEEVFRAWTDPDEMKEWYCPEGGTVDDVEVDLTVGGRYKIAMRMPDAVHVTRGVFREIQRPRRIAFTWRWEGGDMGSGESLVTVEFRERGEDTEVVLTHERLANEESRGMHEHGWTSILNKLEARYQG